MARPTKEAKDIETMYMNVIGRILCISKQHRMAVNHYVEKNDLQKSQHHLLLTLNQMIETKQTVSQRDLAEKMNVTPAAVAVTLKKLEKNGIVAKTTSEKDNRYNEVTITAKGQQIVKESKKVFRSTDQQMFKDFSREELEQLQDYLGRVLDNLHPMVED